MDRVITEYRVSVNDEYYTRFDTRDAAEKVYKDTKISGDIETVTLWEAKVDSKTGFVHSLHFIKFKDNWKIPDLGRDVNLGELR